MAVRDTLHEKDGAWKLDSKIAAGIDDQDNTHPLNCTEDGTLEVQLSGTDVPVDVIVENIVPVSQSGTWTVTLAAAPVIDIGEVSIIPSPTVVNIFATDDSVGSGVETTILTYTNVGISFVTQLIAWGTYDGEFLIRINGTIRAGGRTSAADRTLQLIEPISTLLGDVITVTILEYGPGLQQFRCNLIGQ